MDYFFDFIERRKFGILATFIVHMALFMYLQIETYTTKVYYGDNDVYARIEQNEEVIPIDSENIELPDDAENWSGAVKNITQDVHDKRERSTEGFSRTSVDSKVEANVRDLERQFFEEFQQGRIGGSEGNTDSPSKTVSGKSETSNKEKSSKSSSEKNAGTKSGGDGGKTVYAGKTMVSYDLEGRTPHNGNDWYIRNPGYTCGFSSNGTVVVAIRVNQNGDVIAARYVQERSKNANSCMIEKAQEYALLSRFAYNSSAAKTQEGYITYNFVSQ